MIDWKKCEHDLALQQNKLVIAAMRGDLDEIKEIQNQMVRMFSLRALAVRKVTNNKGKRTAGVDGKRWVRSSQKMEAVTQLKDLSTYKPQPVKRVWLPKPGKKEKRPLGIPTLFDRAVQALFLYTLEPVTETWADKRSFGFRKSRSTHDAAEYIRLMCASKYGKRYVLEVDIRKFFDTINHDWLIDNTPMNKQMLKKLLEAGVLEYSRLEPGEAGVPQGGVLSPTLANRALDGLEKALTDKTGSFLVRYADDFVITGKSVEQLEKAMDTVADFLKPRGLKVNVEKTKITRIEKGFDFLGFHFREYPDETRAKGEKKGIFLIKPTKNNVQKICRKISEIVKKYPSAEAGTIIKHLNPVMRGWAEYYRTVSSRDAFRKVSNHTFRSLQRWVYRKHGRSKKRGNLAKYFKTVATKKTINNWVFSGVNERKQPITLFQIGNTNFKKHTMINLEKFKNPFLIDDAGYFIKRSKSLVLNSVIFDKRKKQVIMSQQGRCAMCETPFEHEDRIELHHIKPFKERGSNKLSNMQALHAECHKQLTFQQEAKKNGGLTK